MQRERLGSRLGFILLSAGCAIGIGNVWKFPYMAGEHGGGIFVLFYLFFLVVMGIPVMTMEFAMGRASQKSPAKIYEPLAPKGSKWHIHSYFAVAGNYLLMMFYTCVSGWMLRYFIDMASGKFVGLDVNAIKAYHGNMLRDPVSLIIYTSIVIIFGFVVCSFSLQKGLERVTKYMMLALLAIMVVLAVNSIFIKGGGEGLAFYLLPDINQVKQVGLGNVIVGAMNQSFFTLSLGVGSMAIFGSYLGKDRSLMGESVNIAALDTFVAICSGLIIFPACTAYGVEVDSGPPLIFITLPNIFNNIPLGRFWGSLFFVFLSFAALSTVLAVFENIIACTMDLFGFSRKKACVVNCIAMLVLALPCIFGFNLLSGFHPFGGDSTILDLEDFAVSQVLLPLGSLLFVLFCTSRYGWGWKKFTEEANTGKGFKVANWMRGYMTYVLPVIILALFVVGIINFFKIDLLKNGVLDLIGQCFGILACVLSVISMLSKRITGALIFQMAANVTIAINFGLTNGLSGAIVCIIGSIQTLTLFIMRRKDKEPKWWLLLIFLAAYISASVFTFNYWFDILSAIAAVTFAVAVMQKNPANYRIIMLINSCLWLVFDFCAGSYGAIVTHTVILISIIAGMVKNDIKKEIAE